MNSYLEKAYEDFEKLSDQITKFYKTYHDSFANSSLNNSINVIYDEHRYLETQFRDELNNRSVKKERLKEEW